MQEFVCDISNYSRGLDSDFIIIPQNGAELCFNYLDPNDGVNTEYFSCIDGVGIEELFYDETYAPDEERLGMLRKIGSGIPVLVSDYVTNNNNIAQSQELNAEEGFLSFPRANDNHEYSHIPSEIQNENDLDIESLDDAQNYLYLISSDLFTSKTAMINAINETNYDLIIIDLFFDEVAFTTSEITSLKTKANGASRLVISYINVGAAENWRYYWEDNWRVHRPGWLKKKYDGYDDEIWVKFWKQEWRDIIYSNDNSYMKKIVQAGFDGAYLDNVEGYYFLYFD
jgi:cysteinyl-tRNA synthetase, unknown class